MAGSEAFSEAFQWNLKANGRAKLAGFPDQSGRGIRPSKASLIYGPRRQGKNVASMAALLASIAVEIDCNAASRSTPAALAQSA